MMGGLFIKNKNKKQKTNQNCAAPKLPLSSLAELWLTCTSCMGITDNGLVLGLLCVPGVASSSTCAGMFSLTITKALWKLSWNCSFFQVWNKAIKSVQKYERCGDISPFGKAFEGNKRHQCSIVYNTSKRARLYYCGERSSGNMCWILSGHLLIDNIAQTLVRIESSVVHEKSYFIFRLLPVIFWIPHS